MISGTSLGAEGERIAWDLSLPSSGPASVVVIAHGFKGFKDWGFFPTVRERLADAGFAALAFNASHNGVGLGDDAAEFTRLDLFRRNRASYELFDLRRILAEVRDGTLAPKANIDRDRIGLLGHSRGGAAVILAGRDPAVKKIVTWASVKSLEFHPEIAAIFEEQGLWAVRNARTGQMMTLDRTAYDDVHPLPTALDVKRAVSELGEELFLVHGTDDVSVPVASANALCEWTEKRAKLELIDGADHVFGCRHPYAGPTAAFDRAMDATIAHLRR